MRPFDLTPLYKTSVGFDHLASMLDSLGNDGTGNGYPPYNIERIDENDYRISMAVAGFGEDDLNLVVEKNTLTVTGEKRPEENEGDFLHRGIAARSFERHFNLADHVEVKSAELENGLLHIKLVREIPEAMKPRTIAIKKGGTAKKIESKAS